MDNKKAVKLWAAHSLGDAFSTESGVISFDWPAGSEMCIRDSDRDAFRRKFEAAYPDGNAANRAAVAGALYRLVYEAENGDYIACLHGDTVSLGTFSGPYEFRDNAHSRPVKWLKDAPQSSFSRDAMREITCSPVRLFAVKRFAGEFLAQIGVEWLGPEPERPAAKRPAAPSGAESPAALARPAAAPLRAVDYAEADAAGFVLDALRSLSREDFRQFAAGLLRAMGYAISTPPDGGLNDFEITARRDELFPPVWVQLRAGELTETDIPRLGGALAPGSYGLVMTVRDLSERAKQALRKAPYLRAVDGPELAALTLKYYCALDERYRAVIPLRMALIPAQ